jgi:hypothetical protein
MLPDNLQPTTVLSEARARIIWGEPAADVRAYLIAKGVTDEEADARLGEFCAERNAEIRGVALRNILVGALLLAFAGGFLDLILHSKTMGSSTQQGKGIGVVILAGLYGLVKLVNGIIYFIRPQAEDQSISDLNE